jgi:CP family cyanate transporter-like MFS transporter
MLHHVSCVQLPPGSTPPLLACLVGIALSDRIVLMTGLYAMTLSGGAAAAAVLSVPISDAVGGSWRTSLASWGLFALAAMLVWLPQLRRVHRVFAGKQRVSLWRNRTAYAITIFMAAQSMMLYTFAAWLPEYLVDRGLSPAGAGAVLPL